MTCRTGIGTTAALAAVFLALSWGSALSAPASSERIDQPAPPSSHAIQSLITAVSRAGNRLVAVGERGIVLLSEDDGSTWRQVSAPANVTLTNVAFASAREGWAIGHGGVVIKSADGGESWTKQLDGIEAAKIEAGAAAEAADRDKGPAILRRFKDAKRLVVDGPDKPFLGVHFFDNRRGLVVGAYGLAFATQDGGVTWHSIMDRIDNPTGRHLNAIIVSGSSVYLAGEQGKIWRSTDQGQSFVGLNVGSRASFFGGVATSKGTVILFGLRGNVFRSEDDGATWTKLDLPEVSVTGAIELADGQVVLVDEMGDVLASDDEGKSFRIFKVAQAMPLASVVQAANRSLIVTGARGYQRIPADQSELEKHK